MAPTLSDRGWSRQSVTGIVSRFQRETWIFGHKWIPDHPRRSASRAVFPTNLTSYF